MFRVIDARRLGVEKVGELIGLSSCDSNPEARQAVKSVIASTLFY